MVSFNYGNATRSVGVQATDAHKMAFMEDAQILVGNVWNSVVQPDTRMTRREWMRYIKRLQPCCKRHVLWWSDECGYHVRMEKCSICHAWDELAMFEIQTECLAIEFRDFVDRVIDAPDVWSHGDYTLVYADIEGLMPAWKRNGRLDSMLFAPALISFGNHVDVMRFLVGIEHGYFTPKAIYWACNGDYGLMNIVCDMTISRAKRAWILSRVCAKRALRKWKIVLRRFDHEDAFTCQFDREAREHYDYNACGLPDRSPSPPRQRRCRRGKRGPTQGMSQSQFQGVMDAMGKGVHHQIESDSINRVREAVDGLAKSGVRLSHEHSADLSSICDMLRSSGVSLEQITSSLRGSSDAVTAEIRMFNETMKQCVDQVTSGISVEHRAPQVDVIVNELRNPNSSFNSSIRAMHAGSEKKEGWYSVATRVVILLVQLYRQHESWIDMSLALTQFIMTLDVAEIVKSKCIGMIAQVLTGHAPSAERSGETQAAGAPSKTMFIGLLALLGPIAVILVSLIGCKKAPPSKEFGTFLASYSRLGASLTSTEVIMDRVMAMHQCVSEFISTKIYGNPLTDEWTLIRTWIADVGSLYSEDFMTVARSNPEIKERITTLINRGTDIVIMLDKAGVPSTKRMGVSQAMMQLHHMLTFVNSAGASNTAPRKPPIIVHLYGASGVGKSTVVYAVVNKMLVHMGCKSRDDREKKVYFKYPTESDRWDGYIPGTKIVVCDDVFSVKDSESRPNPEALGALRMSNTSHWLLDMARCEEKGNTPFQAEMVLWTSNECRFNFESLTNPYAIDRRINLKFRQRPKVNYAKRSIQNGKSVLVLDNDKLERALLEDPLAVTEFCVFDLMSTAEGADEVVKASLSFEEMIQEIQVKFNETQRNYSLMQKGLSEHFDNCVAEQVEKALEDVEKVKSFQNSVALDRETTKARGRLERAAERMEARRQNIEADESDYATGTEEPDESKHGAGGAMRRRVGVPLRTTTEVVGDDSVPEDEEMVIVEVERGVRVSMTRREAFADKLTIVDEELVVADVHKGGETQARSEASPATHEFVRGVYEKRNAFATWFERPSNNDPTTMGHLDLRATMRIVNAAMKNEHPLETKVALRFKEPVHEGVRLRQARCVYVSNRALLSFVQGVQNGDLIVKQCKDKDSWWKGFCAMCTYRPGVDFVICPDHHSEITEDQSTEEASEKELRRALWDKKQWVAWLNECLIQLEGWANEKPARAVAHNFVMLLLLGGFIMLGYYMTKGALKLGWGALGWLGGAIAGGYRAATTWKNKKGEEVPYDTPESMVPVPRVELGLVAAGVGKADVEHAAGYLAENKKIVLPEATYSATDKARKVVRTEDKTEIDVATRKGALQLVLDQNAAEMGPVVLRNMYSLQGEVTNGWLHVVNVVFLKGRIMMTNAHVVERKDIERWRIVNSQGKTYELRLWTLNTFSMCEEHCDVMLFEAPMHIPQHQDIIKKFQTSDDFSRHSTLSQLCLMSYDPAGGEKPCVHSLFTQDAKADDDDFDLVGKNNYNAKIRRHYEYGIQSRPGHCGGILIAYDQNFHRKFIGIHSAGWANVKYQGIGQAVHQGLIKKMLEGLELSRKDADMSPSMEKISQTECGVEVSDVYDEEEKVYVILRSKTLLKRVATVDANYQSGKSNIFPSPLAGHFGTPMTKPAKLRPFRRDGVVYDPMAIAMAKTETPIVVPDMRITDSAVYGYLQRVVRDVNPEYRRVFTREEAIAGVVGDPLVSGIVRQTSPGWGWPKRAGGKRFWLGDDEYVTDHPEVIEKMNALLQECCSGRRPSVVWIDTLKDERRPIEKVDAGKTRMFSVGEMAFTILFRQYFIGFVAHMMMHKIELESCVGVNVYGQDWSRIARRLERKGNNIIAGDFTNYDGTLNAVFLWRVLDIINAYYAADERTETIRHALWSEIVNSIHVNGDGVYLWDHSNPSGCPITTVLNSVYHSISARYVYLICGKMAGMDLNMKSYDDHVAHVNYGDDDIWSIRGDAVEWLNGDTITEAYATIGMTYTDEEKKEGAHFKGLEETSFLKRRFRWDSVQVRYRAPLDLAVIREMPMWVRGTIDQDKLTAVTLEMAVYELSQHARETFDENIGDFLSAQRKLKECVVFCTYDNYQQIDGSKYRVEHAVSRRLNTGPDLEPMENQHPGSPEHASQSSGDDHNDANNRAVRGGPVQMQTATTNMDAPLMNRQAEETTERDETVLMTTEGEIQKEEPTVLADRTHDKEMGIDDVLANAVIGFLKRPILVNTFQWKSTTAFMTRALSMHVPSNWMANEMIRNKLDGFKYFRADMRIRLQVNANPFNAGVLLMVFVPMYNSMTHGLNALFHMGGVTGFPHVVLDLSEGSAVEMLVPWSSPAGALDLTEILEEHGDVYVYVYSPLTGGTQVEVSVWMNAENVQISMPTSQPLVYAAPTDNKMYTMEGTVKNPKIETAKRGVVQSGRRSEQPACSWNDTGDIPTPPREERRRREPERTIGERVWDAGVTGVMCAMFGIFQFCVLAVFVWMLSSRKRGKTQAGEEAAVARGGSITQIARATQRVASSLSGVPGLSSAMNTLDWAAEAAAGIASIFGWSKPADERPELGVSQLYQHNFLNANGVARPRVPALDARNRVKVAVVSEEQDEMSIQHIVSHPTYYGKFEWKTADAAGTELARICVHPAECANEETYDHNVMYANTNLSYLNQMFQFWRGTINYHFRVVKTRFHSGRLRVVFIPWWDASTQFKRADYAKNYSRVIDVRDANRFGVSVPFVCNAHWNECRTDQDHRVANKGDGSGILIVEVLNELVAPTTVAQEIQVLVETSGGKDFQFAAPYPRGVDLTTTMLQSPTVAAGGPMPRATVQPIKETTLEASQVLRRSGVVQSGEEEMVPICPMREESPLEANEYTMGEVVTSLRQLLKRYTLLDTEAGSETLKVMYVQPRGITLVSKRWWDRINILYRNTSGSVRVWWAGEDMQAPFPKRISYSIVAPQYDKKQKGVAAYAQDFEDVTGFAFPEVEKGFEVEVPFQHPYSFALRVFEEQFNANERFRHMALSGPKVLMPCGAVYIAAGEDFNNTGRLGVPCTMSYFHPQPAARPGDSEQSWAPTTPGSRTTKTTTLLPMRRKKTQEELEEYEQAAREAARQGRPFPIEYQDIGK